MIRLSPLNLFDPFWRSADPSPEDLLGAIKAAFDGATGASIAVPGGLFLKEAGRRVPHPYAVVEETGAAPGWQSSSSRVQNSRVRFKIFGRSGTEAGRAGDWLFDLFKGRRLRWTTGWSTPLIPADRKHVKDHVQTAIGAEAYYLLIEFTTQIRRD